ncbi:unnamed protein product [Ceutorhynchus assimilis]|uniref:Uncharacterized protein n=1 Tax=Ceutorhynchus assimilis TaxID=467358 RepID=A0A9N9QLV3_9CUCU|nr:unnamed protein product [Ceutorhynchus assimilis]
MSLLMCTGTQTPSFHVDYGIPLHARRSTDYRTSTGKNHGFIPEIPQDFDSRGKAKFQRELLDKDITIRNEYQSTYTKEYDEKYTDKDMPRNDLATNSQRVDFTRTVEERIFKTPPRPAAPKLTEMKDSYLLCHWTPPRDNHLDFTCQASNYLVSL